MKEFKQYLNTTEEYGMVEEINHPIIYISGLPGAKPNELIITENGKLGQIRSLEEERVEAIIFAKEFNKTNIKVARTEKYLETPVGEDLLGKAINPLGQTLFANVKLKAKKTRNIDKHPPTIDKRTKITKQLETGISVLDLLLPIGKGQRELVLGDRKTGKTSLLFPIIENQVKSGSIVIYAAVGKRNAEIKKLKKKLEEKDLFKNVVMVATTSEDAPSLIHLTPYSAMTIAEHFRDKGKDVVVLIDDLTTHAKAYREVSLLGKRFPGRDSYPGDIFYKHAKLLERAGSFNVNGKQISITCLPVAETIQSDLTDYIITNLIGITDGHILLDTDIFNKGTRPAVNTYLSVTRVGKQTQHPVDRKLSQEIFSFLSRYEKSKTYSHFGSELSKEVKKALKKGRKIKTFLEQPANQVIPIEVQRVFAAMIWNNHLNEVEVDEITKAKETFLNNYKNERKPNRLTNKIAGIKDYEEFTNRLEKSKNTLLGYCGLNREDNKHEE